MYPRGICMSWAAVGAGETAWDSVPLQEAPWPGGHPAAFRVCFFLRPIGFWCFEAAAATSLDLRLDVNLPVLAPLERFQQSLSTYIGVEPLKS